jgi:CheY-like chemotaxis protein
MNLLIIEDDKNKINHVLEYISKEFSDWSITVKKSYQGGLKAIFKNQYDFIVLDMSLPTFDTSSLEDGYKFRPFGGKEILHEMKRKNISIPTIVFTQFESFGEGDNFTVLDELKNELSSNFPMTYKGTVYYSASETTWKNELKHAIEKIIGG